MMKTLSLLVGVASVSANVFDASSLTEDMKGSVSVTLSKTGQHVKLSKDEQVNKKWNDVEAASLKSAGYTQWTASKRGLMFKGQNGAIVACAPWSGKSTEKAHTVSFNCEKTEAMRFSADDDLYWKSCGATAVPYGWQEDWGEFNHPFFAFTHNGFYGCDFLTTDGYCMDPYYYGYTAYDPAVLSSPKHDVITK